VAHYFDVRFGPAGVAPNSAQAIAGPWPSIRGEVLHQAARGSSPPASPRHRSGPRPPARSDRLRIVVLRRLPPDDPVPAPGRGSWGVRMIHGTDGYLNFSLSFFLFGEWSRHLLHDATILAENLKEVNSLGATGVIGFQISTN